MNGFYLFLSSTDSEYLHSTNTFYSFVVDLGRSYDLDLCSDWGERWSMALVDIALEKDGVSQPFPHDFVLICDLVLPSYTYGTEACILRALEGSASTHSQSLHQTYYVSLKQTRFSQLRIELRNKDLSHLDLSKGWTEGSRLTCSIHFSKL